MPVWEARAWLARAWEAAFRDSPEYARHVASAWNAFYEQQALRTIVPRAGANPIRIAGTPHDGTTTWQYLDRAGLVQHTPVRAPRPAAEASSAVWREEQGP